MLRASSKLREKKRSSGGTNCSSSRRSCSVTARAFPLRSTATFFWVTGRRSTLPCIRYWLPRGVTCPSLPCSKHETVPCRPASGYETQTLRRLRCIPGEYHTYMSDHFAAKRRWRCVAGYAGACPPADQEGRGSPWRKGPRGVETPPEPSMEDQPR